MTTNQDADIIEKYQVWVLTPNGYHCIICDSIKQAIYLRDNIKQEY